MEQHTIARITVSVIRCVTSIVIPACRESFFASGKHAGPIPDFAGTRAGMTGSTLLSGVYAFFHRPVGNSTGMIVGEA